MDEVVILSGARTPIGAMSGSLSTVPAPELGAVAIRAALQGAGVSKDLVDEVIMGNVIGAGIGQNPARQASIRSGLSTSIGATTVNKVCGSGLKAVMLASQSILLGESQVVIAGGMENMSRAPYLLPKARQGYRMGNAELIDAMIHDGLWDVYGQKHMGVYGDQCAGKFSFSKKDQDDFAARSFERAIAATKNGWFEHEIALVEIVERGKTSKVTSDEGLGKFNEEKLRALKPAFSAEGTITAGNASSISDGAAALVLASKKKCLGIGGRPIAKVIGWATFSQAPEWFTTAPIGSIRRLMDKIHWSVAEVDLFEINEAFAAVAMAAMTELEIPADKINVHGGAVALGHPIGASGARILVTLLNALERLGKRRGVASLCIGGGEAVALAVEMIE